MSGTQEATLPVSGGAGQRSGEGRVRAAPRAGEAPLLGAGDRCRTLPGGSAGTARGAGRHEAGVDSVWNWIFCFVFFCISPP